MLVNLPLRSIFNGLQPITRAALFMVASGLVFSLMNVIIRIGGQELHPFEVAFFRNFFSLVSIFPWLLSGGLSQLRTGRAGFFTMRAAVSLVSQLTWFWGIAHVPLATATALNFTSPLFVTIGAALVLRETVRLRRWSAVLVGFAGVYVILRPGPDSFDPDAAILLLSAATSAMSAITVKFLSKTEKPSTIVAYLVVYLTPLSLVPALFVWQWPSVAMWGWMVLLGGLATVAHLLVVRAYAIADASAVVPFEFLRLPYAALLGYMLFGEITDLWTWVGAAIIALSAGYVAHREARLAKQKRLATDGPRPILSKH
jgi:drug/metabolite transporter (DMT)-like permease